MTIRVYDNQHPEIDESAWVDPSAVVAGKVSLGRDVSVWPQAVIRGDVNIHNCWRTDEYSGRRCFALHSRWTLHPRWKITSNWGASNYWAPSMFTRLYDWQ